jgi:hypothetical protein
MTDLEREQMRFLDEAEATMVRKELRELASFTWQIEKAALTHMYHSTLIAWLRDHGACSTSTAMPLSLVGKLCKKPPDLKIKMTDLLRQCPDLVIDGKHPLLTVWVRGQPPSRHAGARGRCRRHAARNLRSTTSNPSTTAAADQSVVPHMTPPSGHDMRKAHVRGSGSGFR